MFSRFIKNFVRIVTVATLMATPMVAFAQEGTLHKIFGFSLPELIISSFASVFQQVVLTLASWFVTLTGAMLNMGLFATTHLDWFINQSPVVFSVWEVIRDLTTIPLIFLVLWAAFQMILGLKQSNFYSLLVSIVIMGLLINFSFFATRALIDVSNIVSLQFYNVINPANNTNSLSSSLNLSGQIDNPFDVRNSKQGLANIYMSTFRIPAWFSHQGQLNGGIADSIKIILISAAGSVVMVFAGLSFLAVAIACIVRTAMLIFLLAFSPIWAAAIALPQLKPFAEDWWGHLRTQLLFLPAFLLLTYVSLRIISETNLIKLVDNAAGTQAGLTGFINLAVAFVIIFFFINLPLVGAAQFAGTMKYFDPLKAYQNMRGAFGRRTSGALATKYNKFASNYKADSVAGRVAGSFVGLGNSSVARTMRSLTTDKAEKSKYGSSLSYKDVIDRQKEVKKKDKEIDRMHDFKIKLREMPSLPTDKTKISDYITAKKAHMELKDHIGKLTEKEKLGLGKDKLIKPEILRHLKKDDFAAIKKSDDFTESDKAEIMKAREQLILDEAKVVQSLTPGSSDRKKAEEDLKSLVSKVDNGDVMNWMKDGKIDELIPALTVSHLKHFSENGLDDDLKYKIGEKIYNQMTTGHKHNAHSFVTKQQNRDEWLPPGMQYNLNI